MPSPAVEEYLGAVRDGLVPPSLEIKCTQCKEVLPPGPAPHYAVMKIRFKDSGPLTVSMPICSGCAARYVELSSAEYKFQYGAPIPETEW